MEKKDYKTHFTFKKKTLPVNFRFMTMRWIQWLWRCMIHNMTPQVIQQHPQLYSSAVGGSAQWIYVSDIPACLVRTGRLHLISDKLMPVSYDTDFLLGRWKPQPQQLHQLPPAPLAKPCRKFINVHKVQYFNLLCVWEQQWWCWSKNLMIINENSTVWTIWKTFYPFALGVNFTLMNSLNLNMH